MNSTQWFVITFAVLALLATTSFGLGMFDLQLDPPTPPDEGGGGTGPIDSGILIGLAAGAFAGYRKLKK